MFTSNLKLGNAALNDQRSDLNEKQKIELIRGQMFIRVHWTNKSISRHRQHLPLVLFDLLALRTDGLVIFNQVVGELVVGRLGEDSLLPQVGSQVGVGAADSSVRRLGWK